MISTTVWPGVLELAQLLQHDGVAEVDVGGRRVEAELDAQRAGRSRALSASAPAGGRRRRCAPGCAAVRAASGAGSSIRANASVCALRGPGPPVRLAGGRSRRDSRHERIRPHLRSRAARGATADRRTRSPRGDGAGRRRDDPAPAAALTGAATARRRRRAQAAGPHPQAARVRAAGRPRRARGRLDRVRDDDGGRLRPAASWRTRCAATP